MKNALRIRIAGMLVLTCCSLGCSSGEALPAQENEEASTVILHRAGSLWHTDGTVVGTAELLDKRGTQAPVRLGESLFFAQGDRIWKSDGTPEGTEAVVDVHPDWNWDPTWHSEKSGVSNLVIANESLFFLVQGSLWRSEGTRKTTRPVVKKEQRFPGLEIERIVSSAGKIYFLRKVDPSRRHRVWVYDPATEGVHFSEEDRYDRKERALDVLGDWLVFVGRVNIEDGYPLALFIGNETAILRLRQFTLGCDLAKTWAKIGDRIYLTAIDKEHGRELWVTDGYSDGTTMLIDLSRGRESSDIDGFAEAGGKVYFAARYSNLRGSQFAALMRTDGTEEGTEKVVTWPASKTHRYRIYDLVGVGERLFFSMNDGVHGRELWTSDGTAEGTAMVADINNERSGPSNLTPLGRRRVVFFLNGNEIPWVSDGTAEGTFSLVGDAKASTDL